jgi:hypothetical protein
MPGKIERIDVFMARLKKIPKREKRKVWSLCANELRYLRNAKIESPTIRSKADGTLTLTTVRRYTSDYRRAIAALDPRHPALTYFRIAQADQRTVRNDGRATVAATHRSLRVIDPEPLIETAVALLTSRAYIDVVAGLALLTGRRPIELLYTARLTKTRGRSAKHSVIFDGQAKTRGAASAQIGPYPIPVLAEPKLILDAFDRLRSRVSFRDLEARFPVSADLHKKIAQRTGKPLADAVRAAYGRDLRPGYTFAPKDLRAAYTTIAHARYAPAAISETAYAAEILGHSKDDVVTALSYKRFRLESTLPSVVAATDQKELRALIRRRKRERNAVADPMLQARINDDIIALESLLSS